MCRRFEIIYNPGMLQSAVDALSRCCPLYMLCVLVDQERVADSDEELQKFFELDLEDVHVAINLVNSGEEVNMMSWDVIHKATQDDGTMLKLIDRIRRGMPNSGLELDKSLRE